MSDSPKAPLPATEDSSPETAGEASGTGPLPGEPGFKAVLSKNAAKRANASVIGMILALAVSIACILPVILLNAQPKQPGYDPKIDVSAVAGNAAPVAGFTPAAPVLPSGWHPNYARWKSGTESGVPTWEIGFVSPEQGFVGLTQTRKGNPTWVAQIADNAPVTGKRTIDGQDWTLRDKGAGPKTLVLEHRGYTLVLNGRADLKEFDVVASAVLKAVDAAPAVTPAPSASPTA
ncbi:DUF4245 domain-containing protein [Arthrobacter sp. RAF14]|uniref:DUF4245 domain-containing protein n=1 Tax=Arthrobacter sp. RAF14 TaxID=3233051 RepID=UPI003F93C8C6